MAAPKIATPTLVSGLGECQSWGFSPGVDLTSTASLLDSLPARPIDRSFSSFGLFGASDVRHILATIGAAAATAAPPTTNAVTSIAGASDSKSDRPTQSQPLHFYMQDESLEAGARHMLLLALLMDQSLSRNVRMEMFCELFGNALVRVKTYEYLIDKIKALIAFVESAGDDTESDDAASTASAAAAALSDRSPFAEVFDLSLLKYKERDELIAIFQFWKSQPLSDNKPTTQAALATSAKKSDAIAAPTGDDEKSTSSATSSATTATAKKPAGKIGTIEAPELFDIETLRDHRLRHYYGERFDARANLYDWDYFMCLKEVGISIIHIIQYKRWRHFGQAFELRDCEYTVPNRTLASMREGRQKKPVSGGRKSASSIVRVRGLWSDIVVSPFISFGVSARDKLLFETVNEQHTRSTIDVCAFNLLDFLQRVETGAAYVDPHSPTLKSPAQQTKASTTEIVEIGDAKSIPATAPAPAPATATAAAAATAARSGWIHAPKWRLHLISPEISDDKQLKLYGKSRFTGLFDRVFISQSFAHFLNQPLSASSAAGGSGGGSGGGSAHPFGSLLRPGAVVTFELPKWVPLKAEQKAAYLHHILTRSACAPAVNTDSSAARFKLFPALDATPSSTATAKSAAVAPPVDELISAIGSSAFVSFQLTNM